jgi:CubicO group peptidase (beta-lactamase class C family)
MTMLRSLLFVVLLSSFCAAAAEDPLPRSRPESLGMSSERLERVAQVLRADIEKGRMPGAVIAVARKGRLVYYESFGYLDKAAGTPMPKDAIFAIASMTKPMVGVGIMQLVEESRVMMTDPASKWFPALAQMQVGVVKKDASGQATLDLVPMRRQFTVQDLMRHTSGITYGGRGSTPVHKLTPASSGYSGSNFTAAEFIERLSKAPLLYQPGTAWEYGLSIDVLGLIIEQESGQTLGAYLQDRIWKPLGMVDTSFVIPADKVKRYAKALPNEPDTGKPQTVADRTKPGKFECGGGCAASTAGDYVRFAQMLLNRGRLGDARVLGSKSVDYMTADHLGPEIANYLARTDPSREGYGFGLTMAVRRATGGPGIMGSPGDFTWGGAAGTNFWVDPKEQLVVVFMAHTPGPIRLHYRKVINALVLQAIVD